MISTFAKRLLQRLGSPSGVQQRGMAGHGYAPIPKPDTSMDHVFGDSSYRVDFNFEPPAMMRTFGLTAATLAIFGFPAWMMAYEENKLESFRAQLEVAKAAKEAAESS